MIPSGVISRMLEGEEATATDAVSSIVELFEELPVLGGVCAGGAEGAFPENLMSANIAPITTVAAATPIDP